MELWRITAFWSVLIMYTFINVFLLFALLEYSSWAFMIVSAIAIPIYFEAVIKGFDVKKEYKIAELTRGQEEWVE